MFAAAMLLSTPGLELSIYSTCKRISQKLMRNVTKFVDLIYAAQPAMPKMPVIRSNMEEVVLQGPEGCQDVRIVNSYPSKVRYVIAFCIHQMHWVKLCHFDLCRILSVGGEFLVILFLFLISVFC